MKQYRSLSSTDQQAVQIMKQYRSSSSTDHQAAQIIKQHRSSSSTNHQAVQIIKQYRSLSSSLCSFLHSSVPSSLSAPNIPPCTQFSNFPSLGSSLNVRHQVSHPYTKHTQLKFRTSNHVISPSHNSTLRS